LRERDEGFLAGDGRRAALVRGRRSRADRPRARQRGSPHRAPADSRADARRRLPREDRASPRGLRRRDGPSGARARAGVKALALQVASLARRSFIRTVRQPAAIFFPLVFPVLLLAANSGGLRAATALPGFPTDSFLAFALAVPFVQGGLFATGNAGIDLAKDIQTRFLNRLALTPMRGVSLLAGELGGVAALAPIP